MGWFGKKKKEYDNVMEVAFKGNEVHVNPTPAQRKNRNEARIARIKLAMKGLDKNSDKYLLLQNELNYRELEQKVKIAKGGK